MIVSAYKAATYGIRIGRKNAKKHFPQTWTDVEVEINGVFHRFKLSHPKFWTNCPEIRGKAIREWLKAKGHLCWEKGNPPQFELEYIGGNKFRLL